MKSDREWGLRDSSQDLCSENEQTVDINSLRESKRNMFS